MITTSDEVNLDVAPSDTGTETQEKWGQTSTDIIYWLEAEDGAYGDKWEIKTSLTAIGEAYLEANTDSPGLATPPGTDGQVTFNIEIQEKDAYRI